MTEQEVWKGCYTGAFDLITPESFAHPAKMSPSLCYRIIEHLEELGLLKAGDTILDPMSGTGLTAICAGAKGYKAVTVELEEKFIGFQKANKDYAGRKLGKPLDWTIIQGDSRKLYQEANDSRKFGGLKNITQAHRAVDNISSLGREYVDRDNIGNLPDKPLTVVSPPYAEAQSGGGIAKNGYQGTKHTPTDLVGERSYMPENHGTSDGQIGQLPDKPLTVVSPPYENSTDKGKLSPEFLTKKYDNKVTKGARSGNPADKLKQIELDSAYHLQEYGDTSGNIGNEIQESYLSAMRLVYAEIAKVSDVCVVVTKNPTRAGALRRLDLDTVALLKEVGYSILCQHKALLFEESSVQDLFGETHKKVKGRMSFFKRLSYQKGNAVAQWEDVIFAVKNGGGQKYDDN